MKRSEFLIAVCLLALCVGIVVRNGFFRPQETVVVTQPSTKVEGNDHAGSLALLKRYSKRGPSYVAPDADTSTADTTTTQQDSVVPQYDAAPVPGAGQANPPARPANPAAPTATGPTANSNSADDGADPSLDQGYTPPSATAPVPYDDYTRALAQSQLEDPWNSSDQDLINGMMGFLNTDQQNVFQNMWASMTPDDQQQWLYEMRTMLQP